MLPLSPKISLHVIVMECNPILGQSEEQCGTTSNQDGSIRRDNDEWDR